MAHNLIIKPHKLIWKVNLIIPEGIFLLQIYEGEEGWINWYGGTLDLESAVHASASILLCPAPS